MITSFTIAALAVAILLFILVLARVRSHAVLGNPSQQIRPVDVEAFRNLIDPAEEEFLRSRLPPADFRRIQRERLGAAREYIAGAARNAAILLQLAEPARHSPDPEVARSAQKLIDAATRLRLYAFQAKARIYLAMLFPNRRTSPLRVAESYEQMTHQVVTLGRQYPTGGISAVL